jgi:hypothetical protein
MRFNLTSLILPLVALGHMSLATAVKRSIKEVAISDYSSLESATKVPPSVVPNSKVPEIHGLSTTTKNTGFHALHAECIAPMFIGCNGANCDGECFGYTFLDYSPNTCYGTDFYVSAFIYSCEGCGLDFAVYGGYDCQDAQQLPVVDTCYYFSDYDTFWFT